MYGMLLMPGTAIRARQSRRRISRAVDLVVSRQPTSTHSRSVENETVRPRASTLATIQRALESGGVQFLEEGGIGVGVRIAATDPV